MRLAKQHLDIGMFTESVEPTLGIRAEWHLLKASVRGEVRLS
jgi:hypothetical protein